MTSPIINPWGDTLPYNSTTERYKLRYGGRLQKVSLSSGFSCPNRDGRVGVGGCTFCNNESFVPFYAIGQSIDRQIEDGLVFLKRRYPRTAHFLGYFQAYTNTYGSLEQIKELYLHVLSHPQISGIVVGTRPDCVSDELLDFFEELSQKYIVSIEYGVETSNDSILQKVNRGHNYACSVDAIQRTASRGIHTGAHFMFGFGDSREQMLRMTDDINSLPLDTIKLHQLQIVKGTLMARQYEQDPSQFHIFEKQEYYDFIIDFIERLRPDVSIERFVSEVPPRIRIAPQWGDARVPEIGREIIAQMQDQGRYQGRLFVRK